MILDLNSDLGEGCPHDSDIMAIVTSANICCGFHAGDANTSRNALRQAAQHGVRVGAHPGYDDREHFGRRELSLSEEEIVNLILYQVGALIGLAKAEKVAVHYIKPHGALYNQAFHVEAVAKPLIRSAEILGLPLMGQPGSVLERLARGRIDFIAEGFADRRYRPDGTLVPRSQPDAFVHGVAEAVAQAGRLVRDSGIRSLCVHGDNPKALAFVRALQLALADTPIDKVI